MPSKKDVHEVHESIKKMVVATERENLKEWEADGIWRLQIKHGLFNIFLVHSVNGSVMRLIFPITIDDEKTSKKFDEIFNNSKTGVKATYLLRSSLNNPHCAYEILKRDNLFNGFQILMNLFPFEKDFSVRILDAGIQMIIGVGISGIDLLKTLGGNIELQQKATTDFPKTDPGPMYG